MSKSRTVKFPDSRMAVVVEESAVAILEPIPPDEIVAEQMAAAATIANTPSESDSPQVVGARNARTELMRLHAAAMADTAEAAAQVESAKVFASEIAGRDSFDRESYVAAARKVTELEAVHAGLIVRADAIANRGAVAERTLNEALAVQRSGIIAAQTEEYGRAVQAMESKFITSMQEAFRIAKQITALPAGLDITWVWGGVAAAEFMCEHQRLSAVARYLSANGAAVSAPDFIGSGWARLAYADGRLS